MRRNLLGPSPPHPPPSFRALMPPLHTLWPHPHRPGRLGPDPRVAQGRGCRRRQRLGNILWTPGWTDGRVSPSPGRTAVGWGQSKHGPEQPDLEGRQGAYTYTVTPRESQSTHTKLLSPWPQTDCQTGTHRQGQTQTWVKMAVKCRHGDRVGQRGRLKCCQTLENTDKPEA